MIAERPAWRHEAEATCLNSGIVEQTPGRVRISAINGPGMCGMDYPLKVSELGESVPLSYTDQPILPPGSIPSGAMPERWPVIQSSPLPPPQSDPEDSEPPPGEPPQYGQAPYPQSPYSQQPYSQQPYGQPQYGAPQTPQYNPPQYGTPPAGAPVSLAPPYPTAERPQPAYSPRPETAPLRSPPIPPLGPPAAPPLTAGPVAVKPAATLACPIVSALDKWIATAVQPAALKWFRQPVVEIKQISSYSCRGMNGNPNAHISEHAFGNALDIAEFDLADGHRVVVQYGWHGAPEEQGFLRDVQGAACQDFTTVLAPGANVYHYNHIHVDLMRRSGRRYICEPAAMPGEVAAARARARYAGRYGAPGVTGSIKSKRPRVPAGHLSTDGLPLATPGED